jgi:hypothetical protein
MLSHPPPFRESNLLPTLRVLTGIPKPVLILDASIKSIQTVGCQCSALNLLILELN